MSHASIFRRDANVLVRGLFLFLLLVFALSFPPVHLVAQEAPKAAPQAPKAEQRLTVKGKRGEVKPKSAAGDARKWDAYDWFILSIWILIAGSAGFGIGFIAGRATSPRADGVDPPLRPAETFAETPGAKEAFQLHHSDLSDLYDPLWRAAEDKGQSEQKRLRALDMWRERLQELEEPAKEPLLKAWSKMDKTVGSQTAREKATMWLSALHAWGLERDQPRHIQINKESLRRFSVWPERRTGSAVVVAPCWLYRGIVVRMGHASTEAITDH
jgi:hypothetical protein